ncbi:hypothetical protein P5W99_36280 [Paraburkholderia sp. A3BS-1L]|uniref:hypothetical protein n=1 Tax=Paraburkholderia sp. A3BS-1L TaxID=3028375 RepID=UPI003DA8A173
MFKPQPSAAACTTHAFRAAAPRMGCEHVDTLNGSHSHLRDLLVDGQWITVSVTDPALRRAAA